MQSLNFTSTRGSPACGPRGQPLQQPLRNAVSVRSSHVAQVAAHQERFDPQTTVVLGTQWGDEGKGKLVDILAQQYDIVARAQVRLAACGQPHCMQAGLNMRWRLKSRWHRQLLSLACCACAVFPRLGGPKLRTGHMQNMLVRKSVQRWFRSAARKTSPLVLPSACVPSILSVPRFSATLLLVSLHTCVELDTPS